MRPLKPHALARALAMATLAVTTLCTVAAQAAPLEDQPWPQHGQGAGEQRFSPLAQIDRANVGQLGLAWSHPFRQPRGVEATPIVVGGVMYVTGPWSTVHALDARTGRELWVYDPKVPAEKAAHACCDVVNRGVAVHQGNVYVGTLDGRLVALDAKTGRERWSQRTFPIEETRTITGAPRVANGVVVIGHGGAEYGVRGFVAGYDAKTGQRRWRFYTVPGNPASGPDGEVSDAPLRDLAAKTWNGEWWKYGGGGTVWDSMAYDPELDLLYIGVGNGSPHNASIRSPGGGDNLFLSSIVAVRPRTGEYVWHYQTTPGDAWDYTATQPIVLAELDIEGRRRKVLMQAPKNGFFYVLDRATGQLISAEKYTAVSWASHVDKATGRPQVAQGARYENAPALVQPAQLGGHNWQPMAYDPKTGLVFIPAMENTAYMMGDPAFRFQPGVWNTGVVDPAMPADPRFIAQARQSYQGFLLAWDPVAQREAWRVAHPGPWNGGTLATAGGLVFQGHNGGAFNAYDSASGRLLWSAPIRLHALGGPITYAIGGEQYVAVAAGFGSSIHLTGGLLMPQANAPERGRVLVFKLGATKPLPAATESPRPVVLPPAGVLSPDAVARGATQYSRYCAQCHGGGGISAGVLPDLRSSPYLQKAELFRLPPLEGALAQRGMPSFKAYLNAHDIEAIRSYLIGMGRATLPGAVASGEAGPQPQQGPQPQAKPAQ